ncbi:hypothetical protein ACFSCX_24095 [Bacillus salitolerans]|uniref:ABC transporter permease n=1 Tax=Bacillus salitolerans TaxID=1437434 RepID=A0ABW4LYE5_9BACI
MRDYVLRLIRIFPVYISLYGVSFLVGVFSYQLFLGEPIDHNIYLSGGLIGLLVSLLPALLLGKKSRDISNNFILALLGYLLLSQILCTLLPVLIVRMLNTSLSGTYQMLSEIFPYYIYGSRYLLLNLVLSCLFFLLGIALLDNKQVFGKILKKIL